MLISNRPPCNLICVAAISQQSNPPQISFQFPSKWFHPNIFSLHWGQVDFFADHPSFYKGIFFAKFLLFVFFMSAWHLDIWPRMREKYIASRKVVVEQNQRQLSLSDRRFKPKGAPYQTIPSTSLSKGSLPKQLNFGKSSKCPLTSLLGIFPKIHPFW